MPVSCYLTPGKHPLSFFRSSKQGYANPRRGDPPRRTAYAVHQLLPNLANVHFAAEGRVAQEPGSLCSCVRCNTHRLIRVPAKIARGKAVELKMRNRFQPCRLVNQGMPFKHFCRKQESRRVARIVPRGLNFNPRSSQQKADGWTASNHFASSKPVCQEWMGTQLGAKRQGASLQKEHWLAGAACFVCRPLHGHATVCYRLECASGACFLCLYIMCEQVELDVERQLERQ